MVREEKLKPPMKIRANVAFDSQRGLYDLTFKALGYGLPHSIHGDIKRSSGPLYAKQAVKWVYGFETKYSASEAIARSA